MRIIGRDAEKEMLSLCLRSRTLVVKGINYLLSVML